MLSAKTLSTRKTAAPSTAGQLNRPGDPSGEGASGATPVGQSPPAVHRFFAAIEHLQSLCQGADEDASGRMQQVDLVQDELIRQLDDLDACLQTEIARLTAARQTGTPPPTATSAPGQPFASLPEGMAEATSPQDDNPGPEFPGPG